MTKIYLKLTLDTLMEGDSHKYVTSSELIFMNKSNIDDKVKKALISALKHDIIEHNENSGLVKMISGEAGRA